MLQHDLYTDFVDVFLIPQVFTGETRIPDVPSPDAFDFPYVSYIAIQPARTPLNTSI